MPILCVDYELVKFPVDVPHLSHFFVLSYMYVNIIVDIR